jgi:hypothetical protein
MTFIVNLYGELEAIDEESVSLDSSNEFIEQWLMEQYESED